MKKAPAKSFRPLTGRVSEALKALEKAGSRKTREEMGPRYGIIAKKAFGAPVGKIRALAKSLGRDHALAEALWRTGWYEARLLAAFVGDPALLTPAQMHRWRRDFENWGDCDTVCFALFDQSPHAPGRVFAWAKLKDEYGKRAAFALLASLALHKHADEAWLMKTLPLIESASTDERNFVKKGVNWALRAVGGRSKKLNAACVALAKKLAASDDATARWIGKDALKGLTSAATAKRLARA